MDDLINLKKKFKLCASVAYYQSKHFHKEKWRVLDDKKMILKLFEDKNEQILQVYEVFYYDILLKSSSKNDMLASHGTQVDINLINSTDENNLADFYDNHKQSISEIRKNQKKQK